MQDNSIVHISADNENELQKNLFNLQLEMDGRTPDVISIYQKGSKIIAWLRVDRKYLQLAASTPVTQKVTKKTKKKATKKKAR